MATVLVSKLIELAMNDISEYGTGETVTTADSTLAVDYLNGILRRLSGAGATISASTAVTASLVAGTASYTVGSAGAINTPKPLSLLHAAVRDSSNIDHELRIVETAYFEGIADKTHQGRPEIINYRKDTATGNGKVYLWPTPISAETLRVVVLGPYTDVADGTSTLGVPDEYQSFLRRSLAIDLAPAFGQSLTPWYLQLWQDERREIQAANASKRAVRARLDDLPTEHNNTYRFPRSVAEGW